MVDFNHLLTEHIQVFQDLGQIEPQIQHAAKLVKKALTQENKILICGNGGSAADSQHFAAELTGHYQKERKPLAALALTTDCSALTAIGNDYQYRDVFTRQVEALGKPGDVLIGISTSGNSENVIDAINKAKSMGIDVIGLTGKDGGKMTQIFKDQQALIRVPHPTTSRIQEAHIFVLHYLCEYVDGDIS
ncbi:phosphoheptose isomerase [bacterium K02(2017)]|nr:phosphoheptose isomerase [bacterium K02(2017)]